MFSIVMLDQSEHVVRTLYIMKYQNRAVSNKMGFTNKSGRHTGIYNMPHIALK